jgi:LysM repeat protein
MAEEARHLVSAGESVRLVARRYGVTPLKLMELNPYLDPTALRAGQEILLPPRAKAPPWPFLLRPRRPRPP